LIVDSHEQILESVSPNGNVIARVEQNETTCYFYLQGDDSEVFAVKSCWCAI